MTTHAPTMAFAGIDCLDIDVQVQIAVGFKRALEVPAAGGHNLLMIGPIEPAVHIAEALSEKGLTHGIL